MPYAVTKAAQLQLVKCLAVTVGPKIRVNTVLPGLLLTEWVRIRTSYVCLPSCLMWIPGPQIPRRAHRGNQEHGCAQARDISGGLRRCVCDAGEELEHDWNADPGGRRVEYSGGVDVAARLGLVERYRPGCAMCLW